MSWQAMMCRHVLYNSVGLFVAFGILFGMVLHLWLWRRRCAPRNFQDWSEYVPFGLKETRLVHVIDGRKMKMPAMGDPTMTIPERAFYRLLVAPNWLTPDKYPTPTELAAGEVGCLLSPEGAVRVRVRKEYARSQKRDGGEAPRSITDRVRELTASFLASGPISSNALEAAYSILIRDWVDQGCPKFY